MVLEEQAQRLLFKVVDVVMLVSRRLDGEDSRSKVLALGWDVVNGSFCFVLTEQHWGSFPRPVPRDRIPTALLTLSATNH